MRQQRQERRSGTNSRSVAVGLHARAEIPPLTLPQSSPLHTSMRIAEAVGTFS